MDDGLRSTRVQNYMLFRGESLDYSGDGGVNKPLNLVAYRKKLREGGIGRRPGKVYEERKSEVNDEWSPYHGLKMDVTYEKIAVLPAGTSYYEDNDVINGQGYDYYLVATSTSGTGPVETNYKFSPASATVTAAAHDNVAPLPPTNPACQVIDNGLDPVHVRLTWTRSYDDPLYQTGGPGDRASIAEAIAGGIPRGPAGAFGTDRASATGINPLAGGSASSASPSGDTLDPGTAAAGATPPYAILGDKQGDAAKAKRGEWVAPPGVYWPSGRKLWNVKDNGLDAGAGDVVTYKILKNSQFIYYYPETPGNDVEYIDWDVSPGNIYYYTIYAEDAEPNTSEGAGPVIADLTNIPGDGGIIASPWSPYGAGTGFDPYGAADISAPAVESGWGAGGVEPSCIISYGPNPVTASARITFKLEAPGAVRLAVYDLAGRRVATLAEGHYAAGEHAVSWRADVPTGIYIYRLEAAGKVAVRKLVVAN
jgi:hypothetical protein